MASMRVLVVLGEMKKKLVQKKEFSRLVAVQGQ
jgi:hypothetical protein